MNERRRDIRVPISLQLEIAKVFKQDHVEIPEINAVIELTDISKSGIGFVTTTPIPLNFYFDATIDFGADDKLICTIIKVVRASVYDETYIEYGCEFVGLSPVFKDIIAEYEEELTKAEMAAHKNEQE